MIRLAILAFAAILLSCYWNTSPREASTGGRLPVDSLHIVNDIPPPKGYHRTGGNPGSFANWLRQLPLRKDNHVYLFNGSLKSNQAAQFAVLDLPIGKTDLQQCADVVMRLRAEYLFSQGRYDEIEFKDNNATSYKWRGGSDRLAFQHYLDQVFAYCGTASLQKQLRPLGSDSQAGPGDVLVNGGFPGHAMMIVDEAVDDQGNKVFMLVQGYMPAQDIHITKNPGDHALSPWYSLPGGETIVTPEWTFRPNSLRSWE